MFMCHLPARNGQSLLQFAEKGKGGLFSPAVSHAFSRALAPEVRLLWFSRKLPTRPLWSATPHGISTTPLRADNCAAFESRTTNRTIYPPGFTSKFVLSVTPV
jgi:hypothetical protein